MNSIVTGIPYLFHSMKGGTLFIANDGDFKTYFIKVDDPNLKGAICLKTNKSPLDGFAGKPGFFDYEESDKDSYYTPNDVFFKIHEESLSVSKKQPDVGDALLIGNNACVCVRSSNEKIIIRLSTGSVVTLFDNFPRAIFEKWSLVRKVGDVETTLLEYPGA